MKRCLGQRHTRILGNEEDVNTGEKKTKTISRLRYAWCLPGKLPSETTGGLFQESSKLTSSASPTGTRASERHSETHTKGMCLENPCCGKEEWQITRTWKMDFVKLDLGSDFPPLKKSFIFTKKTFINFYLDFQTQWTCMSFCLNTWCLFTFPHLLVY